MAATAGRAASQAEVEAVAVLKVTRQGLVRPATVEPAVMESLL
jgi:hypothetical protein